MSNFTQLTSLKVNFDARNETESTVKLTVHGLDGLRMLTSAKLSESRTVNGYITASSASMKTFMFYNR